jgi:hypothetical protein
MPSAISKPDDYQALVQLPKDKDVLDFVWKKLSESCGPVKSEMLQDLLEMHRTSNGFNPMELSKGRVKRIKASDYKKVLIEINASLQALIHSQEYKEMMMRRKNYESVLTAFNQLHAKLEKNIFDQEITDEISRLKKDLVELEEYELLLCMYRLCQGYFESCYSGNSISGVIEEYNQVKMMAEINGEHTFTGLKTIQLVGQAENGNRNNQALINLYDDLCKLLIRQTGTKAKYETLTRIIKVSAHLDNKKHYMEPYLAYTQLHFEEIVQALPSSARGLNITLAVFLNREPLPVRIAYLNKAIDDASRSRSHDELALFKMIHAELSCDGHDYDFALKLLDEADYIILKMNVVENTAELKFRSAQTRFFIYVFLMLEGRREIEADVFEELISMTASSGTKRLDADTSVLEMQGLYLFIYSRFSEAKSIFIRCVKNRENESHPVFYIIDTFFQELFRKNPDQDLLHSKIKQLEQLKEIFYSTLWARILKGAILKREVYGEVAL